MSEMPFRTEPFSSNVESLARYVMLSLSANVEEKLATQTDAKKYCHKSYRNSSNHNSQKTIKKIMFFCERKTNKCLYYINNTDTI